MEYPVEVLAFGYLTKRRREILKATRLFQACQAVDHMLLQTSDQIFLPAMNAS
ncbi:hypothetical protein [Pseudomonas mangiferae]|uniref:hypothetical protein n=1 Tax=Pseudomonas mangiferae TaxID=2593654 RepID=UPI0015B41D82|nr:hypothetical protein [Pseudomonas mangiferae]